MGFPRFSDDGCFLACVSPTDRDGTSDFISVWDMTSGEQVADLRGHTALVHDIAFSPCGTFFTSGDMSGVLGEWEVARGKTTRLFFEK